MTFQFEQPQPRNIAIPLYTTRQVKDRIEKIAKENGISAASALRTLVMAALEEYEGRK